VNRAEETARALRVKEEHEADLLAKANVLGVGVGFRHRAGRATGEISIIVMVRRKQPAAELAAGDLVPTEIDGVSVDVHEVGEIEAKV
jgi:hypothetical protein